MPLGANKYRYRVSMVAGSLCIAASSVLRCSMHCCVHSGLLSKCTLDVVGGDTKFYCLRHKVQHQYVRTHEL